MSSHAKQVNHQDVNIICILPPACSVNSNGINTLNLIYKALQRSAPKQTIFVCKPNNNSTIDLYQATYDDAFRFYSDDDKDFLFHSLCKNQFVMVRPDDLEGINNEIHWDLAKADSCIAIVNILLAPPFAFANKISIANYYGNKDLFLLANQALMPAFAGMDANDLFLETRLESLLLDFLKNNTIIDRSIVSIYIGKGIVRPLPNSIFDFLAINNIQMNSEQIVLIKRSWPASKEELYSILASSRVLISYDPFSHIERVATILGTPIIKLVEFNLRELPGVTVHHSSSSTNIQQFHSSDKIHKLSMRDYDKRIEASRLHLDTIVSDVIRLASCSSSLIQLSDNFIPYSHRCLFAFSSQFRALIPYMGAIHFSRYNESLTNDDLLELMGCSNNERSMRPIVNSYIDDINYFSYLCSPHALTSSTRAYYQYRQHHEIT